MLVYSHASTCTWIHTHNMHILYTPSVASLDLYSSCGEVLGEGVMAKDPRGHNYWHLWMSYRSWSGDMECNLSKQSHLDQVVNVHMPLPSSKAWTLSSCLISISVLSVFSMTNHQTISVIIFLALPYPVSPYLYKKSILSLAPHFFPLLLHLLNLQRNK